MKERINLLMEKENMKPGAFAESIGVQQSTLSHILNGRNNPSLDVIMKVHQRYSYINLEWLLYGTGDMEKKAKAEALANPYSSTSKQHPTLFDQNLVNPSNFPDDSKNRKEIGLEKPEKAAKETVIQEIKYIEKPQRRITEIRIFFDDNTYETFKGEK